MTRCAIGEKGSSQEYKERAHGATYGVVVGFIIMATLDNLLEPIIEAFVL